MGLLQGGLSLSRYRLTETPPELTDEYLSGRLIKNSFVDIENAPEEMSLGWVEIGDHMATNFDPASFRFGGFLGMTLRLDTRKVPGKTVARYYAVRGAEYIAKTGREPNSLAKKELKEAVRAELLRRALVNTELMEVVWLHQENEIWVAAAGEKRREFFDDLWGRTFGLSLQLLVPVTMGLEVLPENRHKALLDLKPSSFQLGGAQ